jgi:hypothetical protein
LGLTPVIIEAASDRAHSSAALVFTPEIAVDKQARAIAFNALHKPLANGEYAVGMMPAVDGKCHRR